VQSPALCDAATAIVVVECGEGSAEEDPEDSCCMLSCSTALEAAADGLSDRSPLFAVPYEPLPCCRRAYGIELRRLRGQHANYPLTSQSVSSACHSARASRGVAAYSVKLTTQIG
jgi:hypothetical protein